MKFRAKLVNLDCMQHFSRVVGTIAHLAKLCTLRITTDRFFFVLSESLVTGGIAIWCELLAANFFDEYGMEGVNAESNEIYLEFAPDNLVRCLKSASNAKSIKIKLTKKIHPCLTLDVELPSLTAMSRIVTHDIPVDVIPRRQWINYAEPESPDFDVSIYMPDLRILRNVVDRMKNLGAFVTISAATGEEGRIGGGGGASDVDQGQMKLCVETDLVTVTTHFRDLGLPSWNSASQRSPPPVDREGRDSKGFAEARINIRKLAQFFSGQLINPPKIICNIADGQMIHLFILHEDVSLQVFMPSVNS